MLLAIDVGNTHTVIGCYWDRQLKRTWRISTHPLSTSDEFRIKLHTLLDMEGIERRAFHSVIVSSVVPPMTAMLRSAFGDINFMVIDHTWPFSFEIKAFPPDQVGADRLVNAEAAVREYGYPCIIVDSGTATTICAITKNKEYLGGAIMPGVELSIETLAKKTAKLFAVELMPPEQAIGSNTQAALRSGLIFGYASMIDGMIRRFKSELHAPDARVIATGGISQLLKGIATEIKETDPHLTLKGIAYLYDTQRSR